MDTASALPLVLITLGAIAMPAAARKLAIPVAVAEILYGLVVGQTVLGWVSTTPFLSFLADVGFAFFMFLAGLEIDFRGVDLRGWRKAGARLLHAASSFVFAFAIAWYFGWGPWIALVIGATSVGLLLAVLRETGGAGTPFGSNLLDQGAVGEAVTIVLLSVAHLQHELHGGWPLIGGLVQMLGLAAAAVATIVTLRTLLWWFPDPFLRIVAHDDPAELGVRVGFGLMFAFVGLSMLVGVEPFLGAFIAGTMLAFVIRDKGALEHKLASMAYGFFVPVFFIYVGVRLDLGAEVLFGNLPLALGIVVCMFAVKLVPCLPSAFMGTPARHVLASASLLAAPLTLVIAIVDIAERAHALDAQTGSIVVVGGIIGSLINTAVARKLLTP